MHKGPKILSLDIETSPIVGYVWSLFNNFLSVDQIKEEWTILSFSAKWLHSKRIIYHDTWEAAGGRNDDRDLIRMLWSLLDEADIVIAHNGKKFDVRKINSRFMLQGFPPPSPYQVIDTYQEHRRVAAHTSQRLAWISDKFSPVKKRDHGAFPGFKLHKEYLDGNPEARKEMELYNIDDVRSLEGAYLQLRPWIKGHPNLALWNTEADPDKHYCPNCGSDNVKRRGLYYAKTNVYEQFRCGSCKSFSRGRKANPGQSNRNRGHILTN